MAAAPLECRGFFLEERPTNPVRCRTDFLTFNFKSGASRQQSATIIALCDFVFLLTEYVHQHTLLVFLMSRKDLTA